MTTCLCSRVRLILVRSLNALLSGVAIALGQVQQKKESGEIPAGEAPAAEAAPEAAEEAPEAAAAASARAVSRPRRWDVR